MLPKFSRNQEDPEANCRVTSISCRDPAQEQDRVEGPSKELSFQKSPKHIGPPKQMFRDLMGETRGHRKERVGPALGIQRRKVGPALAVLTRA